MWFQKLTDILKLLLILPELDRNSRVRMFGLRGVDVACGTKFTALSSETLEKEQTFYIFFYN